DKLAESYTWLKNWRENDAQRAELASEWLAKELRNAHEIPKEGILADFVKWLRDIWRKVFGDEREHHLRDLNELFESMVSGMRREGVEGEKAKFSMADESSERRAIGEKATQAGEMSWEEFKKAPKDIKDAVHSIYGGGKSDAELWKNARRWVANTDS